MTCLYEREQKQWVLGSKEFFTRAGSFVRERRKGGRKEGRKDTETHRYSYTSSSSIGDVSEPWIAGREGQQGRSASTAVVNKLASCLRPNPLYCSVAK
jgi:hypothetical protein